MNELNNQMFFEHDVFLSHSSKDKHIVRELANLLKEDGIKVWFDEWNIEPGDSIVRKLDEGLENSRVLLFCMSSNLFKSDWAALELNTFRFRDPLNKGRRFVPIRLDNCEIPNRLAQFLFIDWISGKKDFQYQRILSLFKTQTELSQYNEPIRTPPAIRNNIISLSYSIITSLVLNKEGTQCFTNSSGSNDIKIWDIATYTCTRIIEGAEDYRHLEVSFNNRHLLAATGFNIHLWDVFAGKRQYILEGHKKDIHGISIGTELALSYSLFAEGFLWSIKDGSCVKKIEGSEISAATISQNDELLAIATSLNGVKIYRVSDWSIYADSEEIIVFDKRNLLEKFKWVENIKISKDNKKIAVSHYPSVMTVWNIETGTTTHFGHWDDLIDFEFSHDLTKLMTSSTDKFLRIWDITSGDLLKEIEVDCDRIQDTNFDPQGNKVIVRTREYETFFINLDSGFKVGQFDGHSSFVNGIVFNNGLKVLISGSSDKTLRIWDVTANKTLQILKGHTDCIFALASDQSGSIVASASRDKNIIIWDIKNGSIKQKLTGHRGSINSLAMSEDGDLLISGSETGELFAWRVQTTTKYNRLKADSQSINCVALNGDNRLVYSCSGNGKINVWDIETGNCLRTFDGHRKPVYHIMPSKDDKYLLSASEDGTARLWYTYSGECLNTFKAHPDGVSFNQFSENGKYIASGLVNGDIYIWDIKTGKMVKELKGNGGVIVHLEFEQDDSQLISLNSYGILKTWIVFD